MMGVGNFRKLVENDPVYYDEYLLNLLSITPLTKIKNILKIHKNSPNSKRLIGSAADDDLFAMAAEDCNLNSLDCTLIDYFHRLSNRKK